MQQGADGEQPQGTDSERPLLWTTAAAVPVAAVTVAAVDSSCRQRLWAAAADNNYGSGRRQSLQAEVR